MRKYLLHYSLPVLIAILFAACSSTSTNTSGKLEIVATTGQIYDALQNIGGDSIYLHPSLCGPGDNPHDYSATTQDIQNMSNADIVFYNGYKLEEQMQEILEQMGEDKAIPVSRDVPEERLIRWQEEDKVTGFDPHIWNDLESWILCIETMSEIMAGKDAKNANYYRNNAEIYTQKILEMHEYAISELKQIPPENRVLVSSHDAFNYFARAYNLEAIAIMGISTTTEAGVKRIQDLANYIVEKQVKTIFMETSVNPKGIEALKEAVAAKDTEIQIAEQPLYSDALAPTPPADTYLGMVKSNVDVIVAGLK